MFYRVISAVHFHMQTLLSRRQWSVVRGRRERWGRGENRYGGMDLVGLRQQTGCPKLRWSFTLRHQAGVRLLPPLYHWPPASPRIKLRYQNSSERAKKKKQNNEARRDPDRLLVPIFSASSKLLPRVLQEDRLRTERTWRLGFVVVTRRGALSDGTHSCSSSH